MKAEQIKILLDKYIESIHATHHLVDPKSQDLNELTRKSVKEFTLTCLESMLKEVSVYGINTHSYSCLQEFLINFKNKV